MCLCIGVFAFSFVQMSKTGNRIHNRLICCCYSLFSLSFIGRRLPQFPFPLLSCVTFYYISFIIWLFGTRKTHSSALYRRGCATFLIPYPLLLLHIACGIWAAAADAHFIYIYFCVHRLRDFIFEQISEQLWWSCSLAIPTNCLRAVQ